MTYSQVFQHLLQLKLVNLRGMPPPAERLHAGYNPNARCEFHYGAHAGPTVNVAQDGENLNLIMDMNLMSTPLLCVKGYLCDRIVKNEKVEEKDVAVIFILYTPANIPAPSRPTPLTITLPGPIPYSNENDVPWHYGITISGRIYSQQIAQNNVDALAKAKGKQVVGDNSRYIQDSTLNVVPGTSSSQEVEELLRFIRKSDYKVIDHLSQTPSKISILSLLLCFEAHRNSLMKLSSSAFVPQNITVNQLKGVVASISADSSLGFTDFDIPLEGRNSNKALHISMEWKGTTLSRVLVDIGSALNVLPKSSLMKIDYVGVELCPSDLIVWAFDGSRRAVFGEVDLPVKIGPQFFRTTFFVMDIHPAYCCLLERPWIHGEGAVTSPLHQKMKFPSGSKIVNVCGEEEYMAFKAVQMIKTPHYEGKRHAVSMSSLKDAREVVENGHPKGWGHVLDLPLKFDKLGLGLNHSQQDVAPDVPKAPSVLTPVKFISAGFISNDQANVVGDNDDSDYDIDNWIQPSVLGEELHNWTAEDVIQVMLN
ncbi:uncharacterized protein LOC127131691 [Lathyrus oleraceus]|uniref:uncharacterized protein LOC127131691 n=1 Tax=Pisum sativum TaxID=3888 RepID=UPI0021D2349D|nr:uncharacterized protein LOC127131691 [Pisum sativum]